jgi:hypothetical protein
LSGAPHLALERARCQAAIASGDKGWRIFLFVNRQFKRSGRNSFRQRRGRSDDAGNRASVSRADDCPAGKQSDARRIIKPDALFDSNALNLARSPFRFRNAARARGRSAA